MKNPIPDTFEPENQEEYTVSFGMVDCFFILWVIGMLYSFCDLIWGQGLVGFIFDSVLNTALWLSCAIGWSGFQEGQQ